MNPRSVRLWLAAFFALGLLQILNHPLWQDEWQAWLIARDSRSLTELFHHLRYEGHPALWYLPLFGLSRFTASPVAMQLLHLALATATVYLVLRFAPFTRLQKILFIFGYFPFFEYAVISRNYTAGVLLIFACCAVIPRNFQNKYLALAALLFLLCQTSVYGLLAALALAAAFLVGEPANNRLNLIRSKYQLAAGGLILLAGAGLAVLQLLPPPDSGFAVGWRFYGDWPAALRALGVVWDSFVPLPALQQQFWGTNQLGNPYAKLFPALLLLGFSLTLFRQKPAALLLFAAGSLAILSFTYTKYPGSIRHHGHLFILWVAAFWLATAYPGKSEPGFLDKYCCAFFTAILTVQLAAGLLAAGLSLFFPFSAGRETAGYIKDHGLDRLPLAGDEDDAASVISGYLGRPLFYLCAGRWGTFVIWDQQRKNLEVPEAVQRAREFSARRREDVLLVLNRELKMPGAGIAPVRQFTRSIVPAEKFYLYRVKYSGDSPGP